MVDDNTLTLDGFAKTLRAHPDVELVAAIGHQDALDRHDSWSDIDVVVIDAADEGRRGDQFPGVQVVHHVRGRQSDGRPTVVVITGHFFDDGLRHRMAEASADLFFLRSMIRSPEKLVDIVVHPESYRRGVPLVADTERRRALGITSRSKVENVVDYVEEQQLELTLARHGSQTLPSRRSLFRHRKELASRGKIGPINWTTGSPPNGERRPRYPSLGQLRRVWAWSARVKYGPVDESREDKPSQP